MATKSQLSRSTQPSPSRPFGAGWRPANSPGKFEGESAISELAYNASLDGFCDEETGDVQYGLWCGLIRGPLTADDDCNPAERADLKRMLGCIITEDSQGFVAVEWYGPNEEPKMEADWGSYLAATAEDADGEGLP